MHYSARFASWLTISSQLSKAVGVLVCLALMPLNALSQQRDSGENVKVGSIVYDVTGTMTVEHNNNIFSTDQAYALSDVIISPGVNFSGIWQFTRYNSVNLSFGTQYQFYCYHPEYSSGNTFPIILPGSELNFSMKMGAFSVTPFESVNFSTDPTNGPGTQSVPFSRFNNSAGLRILWNMNRKTQPYLTISRSDVIPIKQSKGIYGFTKSKTFTADMGVTYSAATNLQLGLDYQVAKNMYAVEQLNNSTTYVITPNINWDATPNVNLAFSLGYTRFSVSQTGTIDDNSQPRGLNWQIALLHVLRPTLQYRLFTTQSFQYGYTSNSVRVRTIGFSAQWRAFNKTSFRGAFVFGRGQDSGGIDPESYRMTTAGIGIDYALNSRATCTFDIEHTKKRSNIPLDAFLQTRYIAGFAYDF